MSLLDAGATSGISIDRPATLSGTSEIFRSSLDVFLNKLAEVVTFRIFYDNLGPVY
jgi:hypothetical protein